MFGYHRLSSVKAGIRYALFREKYSLYCQVRQVIFVMLVFVFMFSGHSKMRLATRGLELWTIWGLLSDEFERMLKEAAVLYNLGIFLERLMKTTKNLNQIKSPTCGPRFGPGISRFRSKPCTSGALSQIHLTREAAHWDTACRIPVANCYERYVMGREDWLFAQGIFTFS